MKVDETGLVAGFYEAAFDATRFPHVLKQLGEFGDGIGAALVLWDRRADRPALFATDGHLGDDAGDAYDRYYAAIDPYRPAMETARPGLWTTTTQFFDDRFIGQDEFFNDFLIRRGARYAAAARIAATEHFSAFLAVNRGPQQTPFSAHDLQQLERVGRHLGRAIKVYFDVARARLNHEAAAVMLERVATPAMLVDATARILFSNAAAEAVFKANDGLDTRRGHLTAGRSCDERRLLGLITAAAGGPERERAGGEMLVGRPAGRLPITLLVSPVGPVTTLHSLAPVPVALVLLHDPARHVLHPIKRLRALFGLTEAEAKLAQGLLDGRRLAEIASSRKVSVETVRTQLRSLFKKTGISRQADLMRILLALPEVPSAS
jgi:DNA-binding CsgD family transcriptional regulator